MSPSITFLLPVHNHANTVAATVESVLAQTHSDLELIIIDDASTDGTDELLSTFKDPRIHLHRNAANLELTRTLNLGLALARGEFVARIDADDLCLPERAARQLAFLLAHPEVSVCGSHIETMSEAGMPLDVVKYPTDPDAVPPAFLFRNPIAHPAVMFRRRVLHVHGLRYDESFRRGQDFDLWVRCILAGVKLANLPEVLTRYRVHASQVSQRDSQGVRETGASVRRRLLAALGVPPTDEQSAMHERLAWDEIPDDPVWLENAAAWLEALYLANQTTAIFEPDALGRTLCGRWVRIVQVAQQHGIKLNISNSLLHRYVNPVALLPNPS